MDAAAAAIGNLYPGGGVPPAAQRSGRVRAVELAHAHLELASWLLAQETSTPLDLASTTDAAERVLRKLLQRLAGLITPTGCQALLSRALHLARTDFPFLEGLRVGMTNEAWLEGLRSSVQGAGLGPVRDGLATLLGTLIGLVMVFIGEDLTMRVLLDLWVALPVPPRQP